jgi:hypothetical protein
MHTKYLCCECNFDMTKAVQDACAQGPDLRTLLFRGMSLAHAASTVELTCPNGHTCRFPCAGGSDES